MNRCVLCGSWMLDYATRVKGRKRIIKQKGDVCARCLTKTVKEIETERGAS